MILLKAFYDRQHALVQWLFWCTLIIGIHWLFREMFDMRELNWFVLAAVGTGIFLFFERPLILMGFPEAFESSLIAIFAIVFIFHVGWTYIVPKLAQEEIYAQACNPDSLEMKCYLFSKENCQSVWNQYYDICLSEVKKNQDPKRLSALIGPTVKLCTYKKFDASFSSTRRSSAPEACIGHFKKMDEPSL